LPSVLIVGAGVIGCAIADALAVRGAEVTVLDMRAPGRGASQASAGVLAPYIEADEDSPLLTLGVRSLAMFHAFVADIAARSRQPIEFAKTGTLDVALDGDDEVRLRRSRDWLERSGVRQDWIDAAALREFDGAVTSSAAGGLFIPDHAFVGVNALVRALTFSARFAGARFEWPVSVDRIDVRDGGVEITAGERRYEADTVVIAAGSWSGRVRINGARPFGVKPIRGQLLQLKWPSEDGTPKRVVWGPRCYTVPWSDGTVLVGATVEDVGFDERTTVEGVGRLLTAVSELLPAAKAASLEAVRVGLRPAAADALPVIGPLRDFSNVVMATAHFRNGILLAPLTAAIVSQYIVDGRRDDAMSLTDPARSATAPPKRTRPQRHRAD